MDDISRINRQRWNALAQAKVEYTLPWLELTRTQAQEIVSRHGILADVSGKRVLCLASGGGQDSAAFGLLGAQVTSFDLSDEQLARDRQAADHHGYPLETIQGDMRDLSGLPAGVFDIVWQAYSLNFSPTVAPVFHGVARLLKPGGIYFLQFHNPFTQALDDAGWDGSAYPFNGFYLDGEDLTGRYPNWTVTQPDGSTLELPSPHEYRHTLSTVFNTLLAAGFELVGVWEWQRCEPNPEPGSWAHFTQVAPPYLNTFWRKR